MVYSYRNSLIIPQVKLGIHVIHQTNNTKFLGIYLDENLRFNHHIQHITGKVSKTLGILYKLKNTFPEYVLKNLYNSLILPYISYGIEVWYAAPDFLTSKVFVLRKKAIRAIHDLTYNAHTIEYFKRDKILMIEDVYKLQICSQLFTYYHRTDNEFHNRLNPFSNNHNHFTRNRNNLVLPRYNKTKSQTCFLYQSIKQWSNVPISIQTAPSLRSFKRKLKGLYSSLY